MASPKSPRSPTASRRSYHRLNSSQDFNDLVDECFNNGQNTQGLGISAERTVSIQRVPVGSRASVHSRTPSNPFSTANNSPRLPESPFVATPSNPLITSPGLAYNGEALRKLASVEEQEQEPYNIKGKSKSSSFTGDFDGGDRGGDNDDYNDNSMSIYYWECIINNRQNSKAALQLKVSTPNEPAGSRSRSYYSPYTRPSSPHSGLFWHAWALDMAV